MSNAHAQAAEMVLLPGEKEGGPDNSHGRSDQWLFVVSGKGVAIVNGNKKYALKSGFHLLIERSEIHEISADGEVPLRTLNFYTPPAYKDGESPLPAGESVK